MPHGVSEDFLKLLDRERPRALKIAAGATIGAAAGLALADLADPPRLGDDSIRYLVALGAGVAVGALGGRLAAHRLLARLRERWSHTMQEAHGAAHLSDLDRRLRGRGPVPSWRGVVLALGLALANGLLFALLWAGSPAAPAAALVVLTGDGLLAGAAVGAALQRAWFASSFVREVDEQVARGTLGVWGEA